MSSLISFAPHTVTEEQMNSTIRKKLYENIITATPWRLCVNMATSPSKTNN